MVADHVPPEVLDDLVDLLVACPAFVGVAPDTLAGLAAEAEIGYVASGMARVSPALVVQRGGLVVHDAADRTVDMVAQGEFCAPEADERLEPVEPSLVVWLPERAIDLAWSAPADHLQRMVVRQVRSRIDLQTAAVRTVMRSPVRTADAATPCTDVARQMTDARISSVVVLDGARVGIATDRDLRTRLVARGRPGDTPVGDIATFPVRTIAAAEGLLSADMAGTLRAGYELATGLRLQRHLAQRRAGRPTNNWLDPDELEALARAWLRQTFKAIRTAQQSVEARYLTGMLG